MDEAQAARIAEILRGRVDWEYLIAFARRHALASLLYRQLAATAPAAVPPLYLQQLQEEFRANAARNLFLAGELRRVLRACAAEGVAAIPYKGPALAVAAYGNLSLRRFIDLDIITRPRDVLRAREILLALGYQPHPPLAPAQQSALLRAQHNLSFQRAAGRLIVELHWEVAARRFAAPLAGEQMWQRLQTIRIGDAETQSLAPEDLLLALCVHGSKHFWERLAWVCDIAELIAAQTALDWAKVLERAGAGGHERMLFLGLRLAQELLEARLPADLRERVWADRATARLAARATAGIFRAPARPTGMLSGMRFQLRARRRWRDKARYLSFIFTPTDGDLQALPLPGALNFIYYLLRPARLLTKRASPH